MNIAISPRFKPLKDDKKVHIAKDKYQEYKLR